MVFPPLIGFIVNFISSMVLRKLLGFISRTGKLYLFVVNRLTFPGVMYHELSHALFAFITGAKVNEIKLYQKKDGHLGYVKYTPQGILPIRSVQMAFTSCAPVLMGIILEMIIMGIFYSFHFVPKMTKVVLAYLFISVLLHMDMSKEDVKSYIKGAWSIMIIAFMISLYVLASIKNPT